MTSGGIQRLPGALRIRRFEFERFIEGIITQYNGSILSRFAGSENIAWPNARRGRKPFSGLDETDGPLAGIALVLPGSVGEETDSTFGDSAQYDIPGWAMSERGEAEARKVSETIGELLCRAIVDLPVLPSSKVGQRFEQLSASSALLSGREDDRYHEERKKDEGKRSENVDHGRDSLARILAVPEYEALSPAETTVGGASRIAEL